MEITGEATPLEPTEKQQWRAAIARALALAQKGGDFLLNWPQLGSDATGVMAPVPGTPEDDTFQAKRPRSGLGTILFGDAQKAFEKAGQGDSPWGGPESWNPLKSYVKKGRTGDAAAMVALPLDWTPMGKSGGAVVGAVRKHGDIMPEQVAKVLAEQITNTRQFGSRIDDKLVQWLVRSAGRDDPALTGSRPWTLSTEGAPEVENLYRKWGDDPGWLVERTQKLSRKRGLPEAPAGTMQEVVDVGLAGAFGEGATPTELSLIPGYFSDEFGMKPENIRKLAELLPKDARVARSMFGVSGDELGSQLSELRRWAADQPPDKLEKMTIPQMFQAREKDMVRALKEFERTQRGEVQMRFPETEEKLEWQKLGPQHLAQEGKEMSHCVGGYCDGVKAGNKEIYSLRTKDNKPRVTLELNKVEPSFLRFKQALSEEETDKVNAIHQQLRNEGKAATLEYVYKQAAPEKWKAFMQDPQFQVAQIKGNANSVPAKYYDQIKALLDAKGWDYEGLYDWQKLEKSAKPTLTRDELIARGPQNMANGLLRDVEREVITFREAVDLFNAFFPGRADEFLGR